MKKLNKDEKHCKEIIQEYFNRGNSKKKVKSVRRVPLSKVRPTLRRKLSKEEIKSKVKPERKSSIRVYEVSLNGKASSDSRMLVVGKKYKNISSDHSNKGFPMFVEGESLKLCNEVYRKRAPLDNLFPEFYAYDRGVLFKEYISGQSLTKVIDHGNKKIKSTLSELGSLEKKLSVGTLNSEQISDLVMKKKRLETKMDNTSDNLKNLMRATVETLADFHESVYHSAPNREHSYVINRLEKHNFAQEFADLSLELSHQAGIEGKDKQWWVDVFNAFYSSPVADYLENPAKSQVRFLIGDYYSDNILVNLEKLINSDKGEFIGDALSKVYKQGYKISEKPYSPSMLWKRALRLYDLGKCIEGPVGLDLSDLLNVPYLSIGNNFIDDHLDMYREFSNSLRTRKEKLHKGSLRKSFGYCSIPRLLRSAVNETVVSHKKKYLSALHENLEKYKGLSMLTHRLENRGLFDESKYDELEKPR